MYASKLQASVVQMDLAIGLAPKLSDSQHEQHNMLEKRQEEEEQILSAKRSRSKLTMTTTTRTIPTVHLLASHDSDKSIYQMPSKIATVFHYRGHHTPLNHHREAIPETELAETGPRMLPTLHARHL